MSTIIVVFNLLSPCVFCQPLEPVLLLKMCVTVLEQTVYINVSIMIYIRVMFSLTIEFLSALLAYFLSLTELHSVEAI